MHSNTWKQVIQIQHNRIKSANWQKATGWLFTSVAEDFNSGRPRTNPKSPERDSNPESPDCESDALTTRPKLALLAGLKEVEMKKRNSWLPLTVMETLRLSELPTELFATHLYLDSPLCDTVLTHIPVLLSPASVPFRDNWYEVTSGFASPTEQVSFKISFWHALFALAFVVSLTFSGLSIRKKNVYIYLTKFNQHVMWHDS